MKLGYSDGCIEIYRTSSFERTMILGDTTLADERLPVGAIRYLKYNPRWGSKMSSGNDHTLVAAGVDGVINYWNTLSGKLTASIKPEKKFSDLLCLD